MKPFAEDMAYYSEPFRWDEEHRALLRAKLDAYYAKLYGLNHKQLRYILDPADLTPHELEDILDPWEEVADPLDPQGYDRRRQASDFPGETFRVLKEKEFKQFGEYRTRRLVLEAWERLEGVGPAVVERQAEKPQPPCAIEVSSNPVVQGKPEPKESAPQVAKEETIKASKLKASVEAVPAAQTSFSDFGLYKCEECGKLVIGYDRENHALETHRGKDVEWKKVR
jgi:hypothetical protein